MTQAVRQAALRILLLKWFTLQRRGGVIAQRRALERGVTSQRSDSSTCYRDIRPIRRVLRREPLLPHHPILAALAGAACAR